MNLEVHLRNIKKQFNQREYVMFIKPILEYYDKQIETESKNRAKSINLLFSTSLKDRLENIKEIINGEDYVKLEKLEEILQEEKTVYFQ